MSTFSVLVGKQIDHLRHLVLLCDQRSEGSDSLSTRHLSACALTQRGSLFLDFRGLLHHLVALVHNGSRLLEHVSLII